MGNEQLDKIMNFAIDREYEAANFYKGLQAKVKNKASVIMLRELEEMELQHAGILKNFTAGEWENYVPPEVSDLKIADYMVNAIPNDDMTFQEVLVIAIKTEEASKNLYEALAKQSDNQATKNIFLRLASEEARHKLQLETLYDDEVLKEN